MFRMRVLLAVGACALATPALADDLRCDGTDEALFDELHKAESGDHVGYGETWDEHVCDDGAEIYAEGADGRWKNMRTKRSRVVSDEDQMLALVMPMAAVGGLGAIFAAAAALAAVMRLRRRHVVEVACPACDASLPIAVDDKLAHQLFCPMCGEACRVEVTGSGKNATARVLK
jgi:hypothetical protein